MSKQRKVTLSIVVICLVPFLSFFFSPKHKSPVYVEYAGKITDPFLKHIKNTYGVSCYGKGGGFLHNVEEIYLALESNEDHVAIDRAREIHVNFTEELKNRVNKDEKIRPYLDHYPFTEKGVKLSISFGGKNDKGDTTQVLYVTIVNGYLLFANHDYENDRLETFYREPYEEALRVVKAEGKLVPSIN